jgi:very-short-patch-repair endonuclease
MRLNNIAFINLSTMGWDVTRFWVHKLKYDMKKCVETIRNKLNELTNGL